MEIAKGIKAQDFLTLDLTSYINSDWDIAIGFLKKRITERFIEPTEKLIELEKDIPAIERKYGFAVLTLDCILCETIQAFYEGVGNSTGKSKELFTNFLTQRNSFKPYFTTEEEAKKFYKSFRCGLLHQAQTSEDTKIWSIGQLIRKDGDFTIVNRNKFHECVKMEFTEYCQLLSKKTDTKLLDSFKKKMNYICTGQ